MAATVVTVAVVVPQRQPRQLLVHRSWWSAGAAKGASPREGQNEKRGPRPDPELETLARVRALSYARCAAR